MNSYPSPPTDGAFLTTERGRDTDELEEVELVVELDDDEPAASAVTEAEADEQDEDQITEETGTEADGSSGKRAEEIRLNREQTLADLRELQDLTIERASGRRADLE